MIRRSRPATINAVGIYHNLVARVPRFTQLGVGFQEEPDTAAAMEADNDGIRFVLVVGRREMVRVASIVAGALQPEPVLRYPW